MQQGTNFQIFETARCHQPAVFSLGSAFAEVIGQILNDQLQHQVDHGHNLAETYEANSHRQTSWGDVGGKEAEVRLPEFDDVMFFLIQFSQG